MKIADTKLWLGDQEVQKAYLGATEVYSAEQIILAPYWRLHYTATYSVDNFRAAAAEVQFRATIGGATQTTGGTAIGSSTFGGAFAFASAFDGDALTSWTCSTGANLPQWIGYQFTSPVSVAEVLLQAGDNSSRAARNPADFSLDYSQDGAIWTTVANWTGEPAWGVGEIRLYTV